MYIPRRAIPVVAAVAALSAALTAQQPSFKAGTQIVPLYVTVVDSEKRLVPDLAREDFEVLDNGKPVTLTLFSNEPEAFSVAVMLDTSASMTGSLDLLKDAAEQFIIRLLPEDRGLVGAFNDKIQFPIASFTSDRDELTGALRELGFGNPTRLFDAIEAGIQQLRDVQGRRVVLVFTGAGPGPCRRGDDLLDWPRERVLQRPVPRADPARPRAAASGGRDRRRVLRAEEER
jgi:Ca-activated chloride channel homolog